MSTSKSGADQTRRFGFKETREQYESRKKQEKQLKWDEKLSKENLTKLREELDSLERARFLAPQQNERKRLVSRMIRDLDAKSKPTKEVEPTVEKEPSPVRESDSDDDGFLFSRNATSDDGDRRLFVPRNLRKKEDIKKADSTTTAQQTAEDAEKELLAAREDDDDLDTFLDAL